MKKIISIFISIIMLLQVNIVAFAADDFKVSANEVTISSELSELVPVEITGNKGIMGFKITVEFNSDNVDIKSVSRGTVTAKGNFNTNFGTLGTKFDIVWNNTEEIKEDGTLFVLSVIAKKSDKIKISFSQPDTFNEKYQDVVLHCNDISVKFADDEAAEATHESTSEAVNAKPEQATSQAVEEASQNSEKITEEDTTKQITASVSVDTSQIVEAIDNALENHGYDSIEDVRDDEKFIEDVNKNLEIITGSKDNNVNNLDSLKSLYSSAYEGEFVKEVVNNIETDKIHQVINDALDRVGAKDIASVPDDKKAEFVKAVDENLKKTDADVPDISKDVPAEEAVSMISKINDIPKENKTIDDIQDNSTQEKQNNIAIYVVIGLVIAAVIAILIPIIKKMKEIKSHASGEIL